MRAPATSSEIQHARLFEEPLLPVGGQPSDTESAALGEAIQRYQARGVTEAVEPFVSFLDAHPNSPWRASLLLDLGLTYRHTGYFTRAMDAWEKDWALSKSFTDAQGRAIADRAVCELIELNSRLGRQDRLKQLFDEIQGRSIGGPAGQRIQRLREGLWLMEHEPETSFRCGPMALAACARVLGHPEAVESLASFHSTQEGTTLQQNLTWADTLHLPFEAAFRTPGSAVIVPSLVHWKAGHFAAIVKQQGTRYLLQDPTFGEETWVSRAAIDDEATGYELVPKGSLPKGWRTVGTDEASHVRGKGTVGKGCKNGPFPPKVKPSTCGMPTYSFDLPYLALEFGDIPVSYQPPKGYPVQFELSYTQQDTYQPQTFTSSNVGPLWTFSWTSYLTDDPANPGQNVSLYSQIGGLEPFSGYDPGTGLFQPQFYTYESMQKTGPATYVVTNPDGSQEVYNQADGATTYPRRVFMTQRIDPAGNTLTFTYDAQLRLVSVHDALGQVTTLTYGISSDPLKVTQVQDPFGRTAILGYNTAGQLASITDAMGMTSSFTYDSTGGSAPITFVNAMTTPYGTTTFATGGAGINGWVVATDPMGNQERMEFRQGAPGSPTDFPVTFPQGVTDAYMSQRDVYFWDKRAMATYPGDYAHAQIYHFLHAYPNDPDISVMSCTLEASYKPLEGWTFRTYPGQTQNLFEGTSHNPSAILRVLDDGTTQATRYVYNALGHVTQETDPVGRVTSYIYAPNGVDLLQVHNHSGGQDVLQATYTYNSQHRPLTVTDASGQATTFTYNASGQVASTTNAKGQTTTMVYDGAGYLTEVDGPLSGATTGFTYDGAGRVATITGSDGYMLAYAYDRLDRRTQITYPDATTEQTVYDRLDIHGTKDRLNRWTLMTYNPLRQVVEVQDAGGHTTQMNWCGCGTLESLMDPLGRITSWAHDVEGRVTAKIYPDLTQTHYFYDGTGRLSQRIDAKNQITSYAYYADNALALTSYSNAVVPTPSVTYFYDPAYPRISAMTDGTGTTTYTYYPIASPPTLGAGRLLKVQSPIPNSNITYGYDELGRVVSRNINGSVETRGFDVLGRLSQVSNPLGAFHYSYDGATNRVTRVDLPNGQATTLGYQSAIGDYRLSQIANTRSDASPISIFNYTYDTTGQIQSWSKQADAQSPQVSFFTYDPIGQVLSATLHDGTVSGQILNTFIYGYDDAGNRTSEQIGGNVTTSTFNNLNQMTAQRSNAMTAAIAPSPRPLPQRKTKTKPLSRMKVRAAAAPSTH